jgi:hypothetical protein
MATVSTVSVSLLSLYALPASHIVCLGIVQMHPIGQHDLSLARNVDKYLVLEPIVATRII